MNYSAEQAQYMVERYTAKPDRETVDELAEELGKSAKSIIGKLSREGVYRRQLYKTKQGKEPTTKAEIVANIAMSLGFESEDLVGLDKTPSLFFKSWSKSSAAQKAALDPTVIESLRSSPGFTRVQRDLGSGPPMMSHKNSP